MATLNERLLDRLVELTGERPTLGLEADNRLPLYLRERYRLRSATLFGRRFLLALQAEQSEPATPAEHRTQAEALAGALGEPVVLVLWALEPYARNRLVTMGVPFIVPGSQFFLPVYLIDLRERQAIPRPAPRRKLTPAAQCLILFHLQRGSLAGRTLQEVARAIAYSPIMVTNAKRELESAGICESARDGRARPLAFALHGRELWDQALPFISRPDQTQHWVQWETPGHPALLAGMSALSRLTAIADTPMPTYAIHRRAYRSCLEQGIFRGSRGPDEANTLVEVWRYDPLRISNGEIVDPLSLYLSLRDSRDERVQQQLQRLLEGMAWQGGSTSSASAFGPSRTDAC